MRKLLGVLALAVASVVAVWLHDGLEAHAYDYDTGVTPSGVYIGPMAMQETVGSMSNGPFAEIIAPTAVVTRHEKASWQDPLAALVVLSGLGAGVAIVLPALRR